MLISVSDLQCNVGFYWNSFCLVCAKNALRKLVVNVMTFFSMILVRCAKLRAKFPPYRALLIVYSLPHKFAALSQKPPFIPLTLFLPGKKLTLTTRYGQNQPICK